MPEPVSWYVIESGWAVLDSSGEDVGKVAEVLGDEDHDIFDGLAVATGLLASPRYVASEHVETILEGEIHLDLTGAEVERLDDYTPQHHV
jgi:hypothetical protein